MKTQLRTQFTNRIYETKYDNETYKFIKSLNPDGMLKDTASKVGVTYFNLYSSFKINRITYRLKTKIDKAFNLTKEQKNTLIALVVK
jgi:hypothetical protein